MITFLLLIAKIFLFGIPYFLLIGLANVIFVTLGRLFYRHRIIALLYSIVITLVYAYIYSFWAAYLKAIIVTYSEIYDKKWLFILLCFVSILPWVRVINRQLQEEKVKLNSMTIEPYLTNSSGQKAYLQSITVIAFSMVIVLPISFIIFLFTDTIHDTIFFELPKYLSNLFL